VGWRHCTGLERISYRILLQGYPLQGATKQVLRYAQHCIRSGEPIVVRRHREYRREIGRRSGDMVAPVHKRVRQRGDGSGGTENVVIGTNILGALSQPLDTIFLSHGDRSAHSTTLSNTQIKKDLHTATKHKKEKRGIRYTPGGRGIPRTWQPSRGSNKQTK